MDEVKPEPEIQYITISGYITLPQLQYLVKLKLRKDQKLNIIPFDKDGTSDIGDENCLTQTSQ